MKLKGISPLEQNVDRIVLGVVGLVFLGAIGLQFRPETKVKIGPREERATQAMAIVEGEAKVIAGRLDSTTVNPPQVPAFSLADKLAVGAAAPRIAAAAGNVSLGPAAALTGIAAIVRQEDDRFALPAVPAPTGGLASMVQVTINPAEKIRHPELGKLLPEAQPFDKALISVEFGFSGAALREALIADPDGDAGPLRPIPLNWWRDQGGIGSADLVEIVAVQYERETITNADGTTPAKPEAVIIPAPPGRAWKLDEWKQQVKSAGDVAQVMLPAVQDVAEEIQRPPFYSIVAGPDWQPPARAAVAGNAAEKLVRINALNRRLAEVTRRIEDLEIRLAQAPAAEREDTRERAPEPTRRGGRSTGPGQTAPQPKTAPTTSTGDRATIEAQLKRQRTEWESIAQQLTELGEVVQGYQGAPAAAQQASTAGPALPMLENADVRVWTHDLTVVPGATYRYRARVVINNPLYGRNLRPEQASLAAQSLIEGPWSDWSAPISVDRPNYFFFTSATEANPPLSSQPLASAEMYVFNYGYYRLARAQLTPGDTLFGKADMPKNLKYANMDQLRALVESPDDAAGQPAPEAPPPGGRGPMIQPGKGGGHDHGAPAPQPDATGGAPVSPESIDPTWNIEVPDNLDLLVDVTFLDAATVPVSQRDGLGGQQVQHQVVLRDEAGRILVRHPAADRDSEIYKRVSESAKAGATQGEVKKVELAPRPRPRQLPDRDREQPAPRPAPRGGGGGGGGG